MSYHRKSDFGVIEQDVDNNFGPTATFDLDDYPDEGLSRQRSRDSESSISSTGSRSVRSASIAVASQPTASGLSFILDMEKEEAIDYSNSLHDDIEKLFDKTPELTISDLISSSNAECLPSERGLVPELTVHSASDRVLEEYDISSHRRSSFPHIHVPLKSLHSHSVKNFATYMNDEVQKEKQKKKRRKKKEKSKHPKKKSKSIIFPSKSALLSPSIPEVEKEEYSSGNSSSGDEDDDVLDSQKNSANHAVHSEENVDETTKLLIDLEESDHDIIDGRPLSVVLHIDEPVKTPDVENNLKVPWTIGEETKSSAGSFKPGLFYIGESDSVDHVEGSDLQDKVPVSAATSESDLSFASRPIPVTTAQGIQNLPASAPVVVVLNDDDKPMVSTSIREATRDTPIHVLDRGTEDPSRVKFLLGDTESEEADLHRKGKFRDSDDDDDDDDDDSSDSDDTERGSVNSEDTQERSDNENVWQLAEETKIHKRSHSEKSRHKHKKHHHHHRENYGTEDLLRRRQRGSEVHIADALKRVPTETEEAITLQSADLDEMASHRMENLQGYHKHKIGRKKKHKTLSSVIYVGKSDKSKRKYFKPEVKKYDHTPHEVFVELDELNVVDDHEVEWREKARWIKFEEDVEEGAERWGKPHVASLSFHSLLELRKGLEQGSLILDLEAPDLITIAHRVVDNMVIRDQISADVKGHVMRTLLTKHKFVGSDNIKSLIRRNISSMDLARLEERHQREQSSLMKTFSQASFAQVASATNIPALSHNSHTTNNRNSLPSNGSYSRSLSVPNETGSNHRISNHRLSESSQHAAKKDKKKKTQQSVGEPGKLELVKMDIDNNMKVEDGVHIGLIPKDAYKEDPKDTKSDQKMSLMRRIPRDAEACTVLVGCVDYLEKPAMAFVRLAEKQVLDNLTEVPLPVRFVFILLGPEDSSMDYHEVGRSISTLMSNQHFHDIAYKAESRSEILHAINEFLNESIVLPPGDWDQKTLLPVMDMARKRAKIRRKKQKKKEELEALIKKEEIYKIPMDPLKRTGRPFGGLINDVRRRYQHYASDFKDGINLQCMMALIFIFFACLCPCIAFGGLYGEKTYGKIGVVETIIATSVTNVIFGLFSGQPLILYGATGPVLVFEKHLYSFCKDYHIDFLTWRVWIGFWVFVITLLVLAAEGSFIVRYITRFTEEVFAILISLIFINEVIQKLIEIYEEHPLRGKAYYCDNGDNKTSDLENVTKVVQNLSVTTVVPLIQILSNGSKSILSTSMYSTKTAYAEEKNHYEHGKTHYSKNLNEPNTALLSTILIFGTFLIAYFLRIFRNSRFLGRSARRALGDFGIFTAIVLMVLFDFICADTYTQKLYIPQIFKHSDATLSNWLVNPLGDKEPIQVWLIFVAAIPAFLIFLLLFLELQLTQMLLHKNEFKLKKGSGFHLDQFILGIVIFFCALFGLPWMCPATVRSVAHVSALAVMSRTHAPGEKPKLLGVKDQRVTNIVMNLLIGSTIAWGAVLRAVPMAVLFGVFLYLGVSAISGVQLFKRLKLLFMPVKHHPGKSYVRRVRTLKMHAFTVIQIFLVVLLWIVKSTLLAIAFPLFVIMMVPLRLKILPKFFTHQELEVLDKEEEDSEDEEDDDPDFYQLAHMPI
ncbi:anion exchange protein 2-like isoform X2 [Ruditapes philippinarum]|uniref:anion exchange protein 2-like isoform X2 n=1 Tax=Ruditapes philippinarum TaxID=129788 RepID=UPI00295AF5E1|nr:anion exchange protein 2-like isoform X2 [Ruditapes philippinarum]